MKLDLCGTPIHWLPSNGIGVVIMVHLWRKLYEQMLRFDIQLDLY